MLEKAVADSKGKVTLVKMNIDDHPQIAGQLGIQSIPAVIAFDKGQPVDGFMGALPESQVRGFIERLVGPLGGGADAMIAEAEAAAAAGDAAGAAELYARVLTEDETNAKAIGGLARLHVEAGDLDAGQGGAVDGRRRRRRARSPTRPSPPRWPRCNLAEQAASVGDLARAAEGASPPTPTTIRRASTSRVALNAKGERDRRGRPAARDHQARPRLERRRRAQAAAAVLRGLGPDGRGRRSPRAANCRRSGSSAGRGAEGNR